MFSGQIVSAPAPPVKCLPVRLWSHECKPWRHKSIGREWLQLSSWFSWRNKQENVWRLLRQKKEIGARKGLHLVVCALVVKGQSILSRMMNLVLLCSELKFLEIWLNQKRPALVVRPLVVKGQSILLRRWTLRPDKAVQPVHHQNRTKRGSRADDGKHLSALITFAFSATITHTPRILTSGDFYPGRSGGHVVPRWKLPDVMVNVSSGENHPTLCLEWVFVSLLMRWHCKNWQNSTHV